MTEAIETAEPVEAADSLKAVKFLGAPADQPVRLCINGRNFEYAIGVAVLALVSHLAIAEDAGFKFEPASDEEAAELFANLESQPAPEGEGAAPAGEEPATGDGGTTASGGADAAVNLSLLDGNVEEVTAGLAGLNAEQLAALLEAEKNGKTRKGVFEAIEAAIAALNA